MMSSGIPSAYLQKRTRQGHCSEYIQTPLPWFIALIWYPCFLKSLSLDVYFRLTSANCPFVTGPIRNISRIIRF